jgi:hypothetical protein
MLIIFTFLEEVEIHLLFPSGNGQYPFSLIHDHEPKLWSRKDLSLLHSLYFKWTNQL